MSAPRKCKYVRLAEYDSFIFFPEIINHSDFRAFGVASAGFAYIANGRVRCYGRSVSLDLDGKEDDSELATVQMFGYDY